MSVYLLLDFTYAIGDKRREGQLEDYFACSAVIISNYIQTLRRILADDAGRSHIVERLRLIGHDRGRSDSRRDGDHRPSFIACCCNIGFFGIRHRDVKNACPCAVIVIDCYARHIFQLRDEIIDGFDRELVAL